MKRTFFKIVNLIKKRKIMKFHKTPDLKYMGKIGSTEDFIFPSGLLQKNLKKFLVIYLIKIHFHEFFRMSIKAIKNCGESWTFSPNGIFLFLETIYVVILMKKSIWKITNALMLTFG